MRCLYRERRYVCGDYLEVDLFPVFKPQKTRGRKAKPTSDVMQKLNEHNAEEKLIRLLNANFTGEDYEVHLTYIDEKLPDTDDKARRDIQNYIRRVKLLRQRLGLPPLKYIAVQEGGNGKRYHFHVTMSGGIDRDQIEELWGFGYANCRRLQFNENGVEGLARYVTKQFRAKKEELAFRKRWTSSKNLIHPQPKDRDGRISSRRVEELATIDSENRTAWEKMYPGYFFSKSRPFYNEMNGGYYLHVKLYKIGTRFGKRRERKGEK